MEQSTHPQDTSAFPLAQLIPEPMLKQCSLCCMPPSRLMKALGSIPEGMETNLRISVYNSAQIDM